jgi:hydroxymethylglutaryl-CoA synthase
LDNRFYDLNSTENIHGVGALAMLITANPRIIAFENHWATKVFDFFKPSRTISKQAIQETTLTKLGLII